MDSLHVEIESALVGFFLDLLGSIFHLESSDCGFFGDVSLDLNFRVLLPASNIVRHIEGDVLLEEHVHLSLDGIRGSVWHECATIVDDSHRVEVLVLSSGAAHDTELSIENILSVSSVLNSIVNNELKHDLLGHLAVERQIFTVARDDISVVSESFFDSGLVVRAIVLDQASGSNVVSVVGGSLGDLTIPLKGSNWRLLLAPHEPGTSIPH